MPFLKSLRNTPSYEIFYSNFKIFISWVSLSPIIKQLWVEGDHDPQTKDMAAITHFWKRLSRDLGNCTPRIEQRFVHPKSRHGSPHMFWGNPLLQIWTVNLKKLSIFKISFLCGIAARFSSVVQYIFALNLNWINRSSWINSYLTPPSNFR